MILENIASKNAAWPTTRPRNLKKMDGLHNVDVVNNIDGKLNYLAKQMQNQQRQVNVVQITSPYNYEICNCTHYSTEYQFWIHLNKEKFSKHNI